MSATEECSIAVPVDLVRRTNGLAIDIGGSVVKFVYRSQDNLKEAETNAAGQVGHLQLVSFPKSKLSEALAYIKERALVTGNGSKEQPVVLATGFGCTEFEKAICSALNIRIKNVTEFECLVKAFTYLASKLSREDFLEARDEIAAKEAEEEVKEELAIITKLQEQHVLNGFQDLSIECYDRQPPASKSRERNEEYTPLDKCEDIYPFIMIMIGSGTVYLQVDKDRSFKILDISERGGRTFHGIGSLLTGCKEYDELLDFASRGNEKNVSLCSNDFHLSETTDYSDSNIYASYALYKEPKVIYSFGKAAGASREEFRSEDLATSWLNEFIRELSQSLFLISEASQIRRMFVCGGFFNHPLVRRTLTIELVKKIVFINAADYKQDGQLQFDFVKAGHHLGAIGALIIQLEQSTQENDAAMTSEMPVKDEYSLVVPVELVKKTCGLSIDIGGTLAKFLYRSKDNLKEAEINTDSETGHLQLVSFPRSRLSDALAYIKQHAQITRKEPNERPEIFATGYGCMEIGKTISETLHIKLKNITEFECLTKAFTHLASTLPRHDLLEPHDDAETRKHEKLIKEKFAMFAQFLGQTKQDSSPTSIDATPSIDEDHPQSDVGLSLDKSEHVYPCILAMIGSGTVFLQVNEDKSFKILELSQRGGRSFHGMGALLTGVMDFDELLELTSRGDEKNVSLYSDDLLPQDGSGDDADTIYATCASLEEAELIYSFGKATRTKRENFKPEDLAASWLNSFVRDISQTLMMWCQVTGVGRLFICGGFCSNALVRRCFMKELISTTVVLDLTNPQKNGRIKFDFLKPEINLGTIGALIVQLETLKQETSKAEV